MHLEQPATTAKHAAMERVAIMRPNAVLVACANQNAEPAVAAVPQSTVVEIIVVITTKLAVAIPVAFKASSAVAIQVVVNKGFSNAVAKLAVTQANNVASMKNAAAMTKNVAPPCRG